MKPSLRSSASASFGKRASRSHSAECGAGRFWATSRAVSRNRSCSSVSLTGMASFNDLVGAGEQKGWNDQSQLPGGLEIQKKLELGWLLHGQVRRLGSLENFVDIDGATAVLLGDIRSIRPQPPRLDKLPRLVHFPQTVPFSWPHPFNVFAQHTPAQLK